MSAPATGRRQAKSIAAEAAFRATITESGGRVVGQYVNGKTPVDCICPNGHACRTWPRAVQQGQGMCRTCAGIDPVASEADFRGLITELGGEVLGQYRGAHVLVDCICPNGHPCRVRPTTVRQGIGMCKTCARKDAAAAEAAFRTYMAEAGARVIGQYVTARTPVDCICPNGHPCSPRPNNVQQGAGMCRICAGTTWDVFYVVASPQLCRVKFGVTSGSPGARLGDHRRAGYVEVVRAVTELPDAYVLEQHVRATLRAADIAPVHGREYFHIDALAVVLDVVDGWTAA